MRGGHHVRSLSPGAVVASTPKRPFGHRSHRGLRIVACTSARAVVEGVGVHFSDPLRRANPFLQSASETMRWLPEWLP